MPTWSAVPRRDVRADVWNAVVEASDEGLLWHRHEFQGVLTTWPTRADASFALVDSDGHLAAIVPAHVVSKRVAGVVPVRRIDVLGGFCRRSELGRREHDAVGAAAVAELENLARRRRALHVTLELPALAPAWRSSVGVRVNPLLQLGLEDRSGQTWIADLTQSEEEVWHGIQARTRTYIRHAETAGVKVREAVGEDDLDLYYALHLETYERTGAIPHPMAYFVGMWRRVIAEERGRMLLAERDGVPVAGITIWTHKKGAGIWTAASSHAGQEIHANDLLYWQAMICARRVGCTVFDVGEAHVSDGTGKHRRLGNFKRKFGGRLEPIFRGRLLTAGRFTTAAVRLLEADPFRRPGHGR